MKSQSTFSEEMQNIGHISGVLFSKEQAESQIPPTWVIHEYGFDDIPVVSQSDAQNSEPYDIDDDWIRVSGFDGRAKRIDTDWIARSRPPSPEEFVTELLGMDVENAVAVIGADAARVRMRVSTATAKFGTDAFATYLPWHKYANSRRTPWGMWFFLEPLLWWAAYLRHAASQSGLSLSTRQAFNVAFYVAYRHEQFHFHVERFAIRQEVLQRMPVYLPYDKQVFSNRKIVGTKDWLEEALAQAVVLESTWLYRRLGFKKHHLRPFLEDQFRGFGGGYRDFECKSHGGPDEAHKLLGAQVARAVCRPKRPATEFATPKREYVTASELVPGYLAFTPRIVSRFQLGMPKIHNWRKWARRNGFNHEGPGPGDHEVWEHNGKRVQINPKGNECDFASMKAVAKMCRVSIRTLVDKIREKA